MKRRIPALLLPFDFGGGFYCHASQLGNQGVPPGGCFIFCENTPNSPAAVSRVPGTGAMHNVADDETGSGIDLDSP